MCRLLLSNDFISINMIFSPESSNETCAGYVSMSAEFLPELPNKKTCAGFILANMKLLTESSNRT